MVVRRATIEDWQEDAEAAAAAAGAAVSNAASVLVWSGEWGRGVGHLCERRLCTWRNIWIWLFSFVFSPETDARPTVKCSAPQLKTRVLFSFIFAGRANVFYCAYVIESFTCSFNASFFVVISFVFVCGAMKYEQASSASRESGVLGGGGGDGGPSLGDRVARYGRVLLLTAVVAFKIVEWWNRVEAQVRRRAGCCHGIDHVYLVCGSFSQRLVVRNPDRGHKPGTAGLRESKAKSDTHKNEAVEGGLLSPVAIQHR